MKMDLTIRDLEYDLPEGCIATAPASPRISAKMLVVDDEVISDNYVFDLPNLIPSDSLLIVNETAVMPARFHATRIETGGKIEGLYLESVDAGWKVMLKSNGKLRQGIELALSDFTRLTLVKKHGSDWICSCNDLRHPSRILQECGSTPIPPYILKARGEEYVLDEVDRNQYQTVYANSSKCESVAAPTAGLHFDASLLKNLQARGVEIQKVTLHVGAGTFKGIEADSIEEHVMHYEKWSVEQVALKAIKRAKGAGRPIIAVGTTSVRTLESLPPINTWPTSGGLSGSTNLMIKPPYEFRFVDGILTNFHLPKSTLLTLVAAKIGIDTLKRCYSHAIKSGYRFYSFGDAMFILP